jgi:tetratricopeptide (TPR) repeat protein
MIRRDLLMHSIEILAAALARVMGLREQRRWVEAQQELDRTGQTFLGPDYPVWKYLSENDLLRLMRPEGSVDHRRCTAVAELLRTEGEILGEQGHGDRERLRYLQALSLYAEAIAAEPELDEFYGGAVNRIVDHLGSRSLLPQHLERLFRYYEATGRYARAEDALFAWLESDPAADPEDGFLFFDRLMNRPEEELGAGGLSPGEVREALDELRIRYGSEAPKQ